METEEWLQKEIAELMTSSHDYRDKALFWALRNVTLEQDIRLEQLEGQLDGSLWSPRDW